MATRFDELERQTRLLEEIASQFPPASPQEVAIRHAARALIFAISDHYEEFAALLRSDGELTAKQKEHLRQLGLSEKTPEE